MDVSAVRFMISNRTGDHLAGSVAVRVQLHLGWTLVLAQGPPAGWQLTSTTDPADGLPSLDGPNRRE